MLEKKRPRARAARRTPRRRRASRWTRSSTRQPAAGDDIVKGEPVNITLAAPPQTAARPARCNGLSLAAGRREAQGRALRVTIRNRPAPATTGSSSARTRRRAREHEVGQAGHARGRGAADPDPDARRPPPTATPTSTATPTRRPRPPTATPKSSAQDEGRQDEERRGEDRERPEGAASRARPRSRRTSSSPARPAASSTAGRATDAQAARLTSPKHCLETPTRIDDGYAAVQVADDARRLVADLRRRQDGRPDRRGRRSTAPPTHRVAACWP